MGSLRDAFDAHEGRLVAKIDHFFDVYEPYFSRFRDTPVKILEIGIDRGGSLELWRQYFGASASIHGIDVSADAIACAPEDAIAHLGSQADIEFLSSITTQHGPFDLIIDDASHVPAHQIASFEALYPTMSGDGIYVCEDIFTSYWREYGGKLHSPDTMIEYVKRLVDDLHGFWAGDDGVEPSDFTCTTKAIHIHSGTVVFERGVSEEPEYVLKHGTERTAISIAQLKGAARNVDQPAETM